MKKILTLLLTLILILNIDKNYINAAENPKPLLPQELAFEKILSGIGVSKNDTELQTVFEKNEGQNIYLAAYKISSVTPIEKVVNSIAQKHQFYNPILEKQQFLTPDQIRQFITTGYVDKNLTSDNKNSLETILNKVEEAFFEELEEENLRASLELISYVNEIFVDGDTKNSGFDLVTDLEIIEIILFKETEVVTKEIDENDNGDQTSELIKIPSDIEEILNQSDDQSATEEPKPVEPTNTEENNESNQDNTEQSESSQDANSESAACTTSDLQTAFENYTEASESDPNGEEPAPNDNGDEGEGEGGANEPPSDEDPAEGKDETEEPASKFVEAKEAKDWQRLLPCTQHFCLTVSFQNNDDKEDKEVTYEKEDNCISCHIKFIFDNFYELNNHGLVPNKVTGNLFENPKCKKAVNEVKPGLNITAIAQPITTPPNDDIVIQNLADISKQFKSMFPGQPSTQEIYTPPKSIDEQMETNDFVQPNKQNEEQAKQYSSGSIETLAAAIEAANQATQKQVDEQKSLLLDQVSIQTDANSFQALEVEMLQMNGYFESFLKLLQELVADRQDGKENACQQLDSKKACQ